MTVTSASGEIYNEGVPTISTFQLNLNNVARTDLAHGLEVGFSNSDECTYVIQKDTTCPIPPCNKPVAVTTGADIRVCSDEAILLSGNFQDLFDYTVNGMHYVWYKEGDDQPESGDYVAFNNNIPQVQLTLNSQITDAGTYILRIQDGNDPTDEECYTEETVTVQVVESKTMFLELTAPSTICEGNEVTFNTHVTNGGPNTKYSWSYSEDPLLTKQEGTSQFKLSNLTPSSGVVSVRIVNDEECINNPDITEERTLDVVQKPNPVILTTDAVICADRNFNISGIDMSDTPSNYQWFLDEMIPVGIPNSLLLEEIMTSGQYHLEASNAICGSIPSPPITIEVEIPHEVDAKANGENTIVKLENEQFNLFGEHNGESAVWSVNPPLGFVSIMNPTDLNSNTHVTEGGQYTVILTSQKGACVISDSVKLFIKSPISMPNVFTPNNDGENDVLRIKGIETRPELTVRIFNRWGLKVFESSNYASEQWTGESVPDGVYFVTIDKIDRKSYFSGVVHLLR